VQDFSGFDKRLRKNHSENYPTRLLILDTETKSTGDNGIQKHTFRLGWTLYVRIRAERNSKTLEWRYWTDRRKLLTYIESLIQRKKTLWLIGHNIYFDIQALGFYDHFGYLPYTEDFYYDTGLVFLHFLSRGAAHLKIVSSTNYFDFSLKKLGAAIGLPKLEVDFETATDDQLCIYCFRDVEIVYEALLQYMAFNKLHDTGKFGFTKASQAFNAYRHRFMRRPISIHAEEKVVELERQAYFGGRVECWQLGEIEGGEKTFLDVNSMYPDVMKKHRYPTKLRFYFEGSECENGLKYLDTGCCIAEVSLEASEPVYALRRGGKLIFPVGSFRTFLCTEGLKRAVRNNELREIHRLAVYENDYIFGEYVDYWYPLKAKYRSEGNELYAKIVKLFLNSLYGKFGQKKPIMETYLDPEAGPPRSVVCISGVTGERWIERSAFGKTHRQIGEENGDKSFVAIAAHVTEYSRIALWDLCTRVGLECVYYMDTDSICILTRDLNRLDGSIHSERLGALSVDKVCEKLVLHGPKHYSYDEIRVCKGVPKTAEQTGQFTYRYDSFMGSRSHQRIGETQSFLVQSVNKDVTPTYNKGEVLLSGRVIPWELNEVG